MGELFKEPFTDPEGHKIIGMADCDLMDQFYTTDVYDILCKEVLGYDREEIMVTDESCLTDFPENRSYYVEKVREVFGVDISDMKYLYIPHVLQRVVDSRQPKY